MVFDIFEECEVIRFIDQHRLSQLEVSNQLMLGSLLYLIGGRSISGILV